MIRVEIRKEFRNPSVELELLTELPFAPVPGTEMGFAKHADFWTDCHTVKAVMWHHARGALLVQLDTYEHDEGPSWLAECMPEYYPGFRVRLQWSEHNTDVFDLFDDCERDTPGEQIIGLVRDALHLIGRDEYDVLRATGECVVIIKGEWKAKEPGGG